MASVVTQPIAKAPSRKDVFVVLCFLPIVQMLMSLYIYSCLPLHMVREGLELIHLGIWSSAALFTRTFVPIFAVKCVSLEKLLIPSFALALAAGIMNCIFPDVAGLLYINIYCVMLMPARSVFQTAAVAVWSSERVKALRFYEAFYTIGYCMSSLWGAAMYTLGGWELCIRCQVGVLAVALALASTVHVLRPVWCSKCLRKELATKSAQKVAQAIEPGTKSAESVHELGVGTAVTQQGGNHDVWWYLALFISTGSGVTIFAYASEWSVYLVYLTDRFNMSVLPIGIGQMSGDIGGAMILMLSMLTGKRIACTTAKEKVAAFGGCLCRLPWSMVWLGSIYALTYVLFLSPTMELAVTGQVMMGTMYVLFQQGCSELVEWCSRRGMEGDALAQQSSYRSYVAIADAGFSCGCGLGSILPFVIMEHLSAEWVCYVAAGLIASYVTAFLIVFLCFTYGGSKDQAAEEPTNASLEVPSEDVDC